MKKGYKEIEAPEMVKLEKVGETIEGEFLSIEESGKYKESFAVTFRRGGALSCIFVNKGTKALFDRAQLKVGNKFMLEFSEIKKSQESGNEYNIFKLYVTE